MDFILGDDEIKIDIKKSKISNQIKDTLIGLPEFRNRKMDISLLNFIMNMLENLVKKKYGMDKKQMLIEIYKDVFGKIEPQELDTIAKNIEYLLKSGSVKKFSSYYKFWLSFKRYFRC